MATPVSVDELGPGDHACLTFSDQEERLDIVTAFVQVGLGQGQRLVCFTEALPPDRLAAEFVERGVPVDEYRQSGQLCVRSSDDSWLAGGCFTADKMLELLGREVELARRDGYAGLRVTADMGWATRPVTGVEQLVVFESAVNQLFADQRVTTICQYDRHQFDPVTLATAADVHPCAVAATVYHEDPVLRVCRQHSPAGVRVAGEIDYTRADVLRHAFAEAVRIDGNVHANLADLRFVDVASAGVIIQAALGLGGGRRMTVICQPLVHKVMKLVGMDGVPQMTVLVVDSDA